MDKLENALYTIIRKNITSENYKEFKNLYDSYKKLYDMDSFNDEDNNINQDVLTICNNIKYIYNKFNITLFNENIISLNYNELLNNVLTTSYNLKRISDNDLYESNNIIEPIYKYKILYLMNNTDIDFSKQIKINNDNDIEFNNIKNDDIIKIGNSLNTFIKEKNIHIWNILNTIFEINPNSFNKLKWNDDFSELSIPSKIITFLDSTDNNEQIQLNMYKIIYNTLINYLNNPNNISKIDLLKFISDNIYQFNIDDITTSINDIDLIGILNNITIDDKKIIDLNIDNITDVKTFKTYNKTIFNELTSKLTLKDYTNEINNILNKTININIEIENINFETTFKDILMGFNTIIGQQSFNINQESFTKYFSDPWKSMYKDIKFAPNTQITNLGEGLFMNINSKLNKYLNENIKNIEDILGKDVLSKLFGENNLDKENIKKENIDNYCSIVFKNIINKSEVFEILYNIFNNYNVDDNKFIKLYYSIVYQNRTKNNSK